MRKEKNNFTFLTEGPIHKVVIKMAIPTIISMLVTSLYNIADTYFVGQINTQSTAAVGIVFSLMFFIQAFGFFFGHGSGNYISRELGAQCHDNATRMASTGFFYSFLFGLLIMVGGLLFIRPLSLLLGSTPTILPYTEKYLKIILLGAPFLTSSLVLNNQMRLQGNAKYSMYGIVVGAILNVALDPLFIFVFKLGISGAAIATIIGQITSFLILFFMARHGENIGIYFRNFAPSWSTFKEIFYGGSPSLLRQGLACVATMSLNIAAGVYGDAAIAAMSIVSRISLLILATVIGLGQGFQPLCGFCYGAGLYERLQKAYKFTIKLGTIFLFICTILGWIFSNSLIQIFRNDPTSYCDWCGGFALAIMHLSLKCFYHSKQHVIANLSQTIACQLLSSNPTRVIFHSFNLHFAPFPWSVWCGNVPSRERPAFIHFNCTYYYLHFQRI